MYVRKATFLTIIITCACLIAVIYISSNLILFRNMANLESKYAENNVRRAILVLNQKISTLDKSAIDWANWDDTYNYLKGKYPDFVKENLMDNTFSGLGINLIMILDNKGNIKVSKLYDLKLNKEIPVDKSINDFIKSNFNPPAKFNNGNVKSGLMIISGRLVIISTKPVLTSLVKGPAAGTLIMGEFMDKTDMEGISLATQLSIEIFKSSDKPLPEDVESRIASLNEDGNIVTSKLGKNFITGYTLIKDISGKPSLILKVTMPSGTYYQARKAIFYFNIGIMITGIICALIIIFFLERKFLSRLDKIMKGIIRISETGSLKSRISLKGNDELARLAEIFNSMMISLETSKKTLEESEEKYRNLVEFASDGIIINQDQTIKYANPRMSEISGYSLDEILESNYIDFIHPDDIVKTREQYSTRLNVGDTSSILETSIRHKNGYKIPVEATARITIYNGKPAGIVIIRDISDKKRAQEMLASEKERLLVTLRSIGDGVITTDINMKIKIMNRIAEKLTGWKQDEAFDRNLFEVFPLIKEKTRERCDQPLSKIIMKGIIIELVSQTILVSRDGTEYFVAVTGAPIRTKEGESLGLVVVFRDITERRKIEEELSKIQRFDTMGILVSGIVHDFSNILTCIIGNIALAKEYSSTNDKLLECINETEKASIKAKELIRQLQALFRSSYPEKVRMSVMKIIRDSTAFVLRGSNVKYTINFAPDLWLADIDPGQISQVIYNIVLNAKQAMPEGGILTISAENTEIGEERNLPLANGNYIKIKISDTGVGIPEEIITRIFDPFFTTNLSGSGLGLDSVKSIISKHQGLVTVDSKPGSYTTFEIFLPASRDQSIKQKDSNRDIYHELGKILIMSENNEECSILDDILTMLGYETIIASNSNEASSLFSESKKQGKAPEIVIVDMSEDINHWEPALSYFKEISADIKTIALIDNNTLAFREKLSRFDFNDFVLKPLKVQYLNESLMRMFAGSIE
ncbi:MAG TPA: PAS domain S-box protein [Desulfomonilia bacterium]